MGQNIGTTRLTVGVAALQGPPGANLLQAVQKAVAGEHEILGELGRGDRGKVVYLAREVASGHLVALQLLPATDAAGDLWLEVVRKLDASVPSVEGACPRCGKAVVGWGRFCGHCGADLSGVAGAAAGRGAATDALLRVVKEAARHRYEILGQMDRAEGGGVVYFARELGTGRIVALRLQREASAPAGAEQYSLGVTQVLSSVVNALGASYSPPPPTGAGAPGPTLPPPGPVVNVREDSRVAQHASVAAPADLPHAAPPAPPAPPPPSWMPRVSASRESLVAGGGVLLLLALGVTAWAMRDSVGGEPWDISDEPPVVTAAGGGVAPAVVDSAELQIGGSLPRGAVVTVDGAPVSGSTLRLAPGRYTLRVRAAGYTPSTQELELQPGQTMMWTPQLVRAARGGARAPAPRPQPQRAAVAAPKAAAPAAGAPAAARPEPVAAAAAVPDAPPAITAATCASLFGNLEWSRAAGACEREAAAGGVAAQRTLGTIHERGLGVESNARTAATWYLKAAEAGDRVAQYRLGVLQRDGRGVRRNEKSAVAWFRRSADQGEPDAQVALARAYERGKGVKKDKREAATWYRQAAEQGHAGAQFKMGELSAKGDGVPKSEAEAIAWWQRAAAQGHTAAAEELRRRGKTS